MVKKHPNPWPWRWHKLRPSVYNRPPFPLSARQRLYEIRKRHRKTEIFSENCRLHAEFDAFCTFCFDLEDSPLITSAPTPAKEPFYIGV